MRNFRYALLLLLVSVLCTPVFALQDVIGEIIYADGTVRITRNTENLPGRIDIGFPIQNFDLISVAPGGSAEITLNNRTGFASSILIRGGSTVYFDITSLQQSQTGSVELLSGSVNLNVSRMAPTSRLNVRTASATMGVRGTNFEVVVAPGGDILLTAAEGLVACETMSGGVFFAQPGQVVQQVEGDWGEIPVKVEGLGSFQESWTRERLEVLRTNFPRAVQNFGQRYLELRENFIDSYIGLMSHRSVIQKWIREDNAGYLGSSAEQLREKRQIVGSLLDVRRVLIQWERIYYRVHELRDYYQQGYGEGTIGTTLTFRAFFQEMDAERDLLASRMQEIRYVLKLYALRNNGQSPLAVFEGTDSFFTNPDDFFGNR